MGCIISKFFRKQSLGYMLVITDDDVLFEFNEDNMNNIKLKENYKNDIYDIDTILDSTYF